MTATLPHRPDTTMGRALASRALTLAAAIASDQAPPDAGALDLTRAETPPVPDDVQEAARAALARGETHYTTRPGIVPLRDAIARRLTAEGLPTTADAIVVTNGAAEAIYITLQTILSPGQRVLVVDAPAPNLLAIIRFMGAEPVLLPAAGDPGFVPTVADITRAKVSAVLFATPSPTTGIMLPSDRLVKLVGAAVDAGAAVILDRSWTSALYDPELAQFGDPGLGERVMTIGSFSTGYGLSGWRVGWFSAPASAIKQLRELKQTMSICTTAVSQYAALAALERPDDWLQERRTAFKRRHEAATARLAAGGLTAIAADAYPTLLVDVQTIETDDRQVANRLREQTGVIVEPGSRYGPRTAGFVRINLGVSEPVLGDGIDRIAEFAARERAQ